MEIQAPGSWRVKFMYWWEKIIDNNFLHDLYFLKKNSNTEISILSIGRDI